MDFALPALRTAPASFRARAAAGAHRVVSVALGLTAVHIADDATVHGRPGISTLDEIQRAAPAAAAALLLAVFFTRLRAPLQTWIAFVAGTLALADGAFHLSHVERAGAASGDDLTGFASGLGGVALVAASVALMLRPKLPRWRMRAAVPFVVVGTLVLVTFPLTMAFYSAHKPATAVAATDLPIFHEEITLTTSDHLELAAWYVPSRNGASVVLVHGAGGDRNGGIKSRALMLARHGYGVLLYDARGSGSSEGRPENLGWTWTRDLRAAVDYLGWRGESHIGVLGLSTGAEVALAGAAADDRIDAVVAEGSQGRTVGDLDALPSGAGKVFSYGLFAATETAYRVLTHAPKPVAIDEAIPRIAPRPVFLISAGTGFERDLNRGYRAQAQLWELPDAPHTGGLSTHPAEYDRRVTAFLDAALL
jgi:hypothetical protein